MDENENNESTRATESNRWPFRVEGNLPTYTNGIRESSSSKSYSDGVTIGRSRDGRTTYEIQHKNDLRHRDNAPVYIARNKVGEVAFQSWHQHGKKHRDNNPPAAEDFAQQEIWQEYCQYGKYRRAGGPATSIGRNQCWYLEGEMVKMITDDGNTYYIESGVHHNEVGPAAICANRGKHWFIHRKKYRTDGSANERANGNEHWFIHGKKHRLGRPVSEWVDGTKQWFIDGLCHKEDDPAIEYHDGTREQWLNGECHHDNDLPAVEEPNGQKE